MVMSEDKILTRHPEGKRGINISKAKYDAVKAAILECLRNKELTHDDLTKCVSGKLTGRFSGSIPWYAEVVKLDLKREILLKEHLKRSLNAMA
jgi:hypothetical protein